MYKLLKNPTESIFMSLLSSAKDEVLLCAPFIKKDIIQNILKNKKNTTKLIVITTCNISSFIRKASDIEAIEVLLDKGIKVYNHQHLHAKVYSFDCEKAIITSANLTYSGMNKNYEYGILVDDKETVFSIDDDLQCLVDDNLSGEFTKESILFIKEQIEFFKDKEYKIKTDKFGDDVFESKVDFETKYLNSWQKDIFDIIKKMNDQFKLDEMYEYENKLKELHPNNNNIRAKIRQILQQLRDKGLIKFEEPGLYKKLIK